jgi:hypothetical protein
MSELNERVCSWRVAIEQRVGPKAANELEDHLRTMIDELATTGLPEEERLLLASHRLGHPDALSAEFAKNDPFAIWRGRLAWMLVGMVPLQLLLSAIRDVMAKVGTKSIMWGWSPWAAASVQLALPAVVLGTILAACIWAGKATRPRPWIPAGWLPTSFSRLACVLVVVVVAFTIEPLIISLYRDWGVDDAHVCEFHELLYVYSIGRDFLYLAFNTVGAVLIAWLLTSRRAEPDTASA